MCEQGLLKAISSAYLAKDNFWGQILGGAAQRPGSTLHSLCKPKICDLKNNINFRFE